MCMYNYTQGMYTLCTANMHKKRGKGTVTRREAKEGRGTGMEKGCKCVVNVYQLPVRNVKITGYIHVLIF